MENERTYRNVFREIGKTDAEIERRLKEIAGVFFFGPENDRLYYDDGDMGFVTDTGNDDVRTEGMSYGMMMCVQLDMKEQFDRIWKWVWTYMHMDSGEDEGYFSWSCRLDGKRNFDGPAPDGEEYFAMALIFASHRWGDGQGIFEYSKQAKEILRACLHKGENGRPGQPMWNGDNKLILFTPGSAFTDPSYHLPHFYDLFAGNAYEEDRLFWKYAAQASRVFLSAACHAFTGMSPEFSKFDGSPMNEKTPWGTTHGQFYSDAYRTAANIGLDAQWFGGSVSGMLAEHYKAPIRLMRFFGTSLEAVRCVYEVDGRPIPERTVLHPLGLLAATAQGALTVPYQPGAVEGSDWAVASRWVNWLWDQPMRTGKRRYYDNCLYLFAFLALSGRYRIW